MNHSTSRIGRLGAMISILELGAMIFMLELIILHCNAIIGDALSPAIIVCGFGIIFKRICFTVLVNIECSRILRRILTYSWLYVFNRLC